MTRSTHLHTSNHYCPVNLPIRAPSSICVSSVSSATARTRKVAALADVSTDTLRYYEKERLITPASETAAGYLTMVEGLKLAAQTFGKDVKRLSCCAG